MTSDKINNELEEQVKLPPNRGKIETVSMCIDLLSKIVGLITWPVVVVIVMLFFLGPLKSIVNVIPEKIEKSYEISVGSLTLKLQQKTIAAGNPELAKIIGGLSQEAVKWILKIGDGSHRVVGSDDGATGKTQNYYLPNLDIWKELQDKGLLNSSVELGKYEDFFYSLGPIDRKIPKDHLNPDQEKKLLDNSVQLSETGKLAYDIILSTVAEMIQ